VGSKDKPQTPSAQVPRTAADVLADGWQDGDDFEISFIVTAPAQPQNTKQRNRRS
jgi:hypothetical protein